MKSYRQEQRLRGPHYWLLHCFENLPQLEMNLKE
jgi:hypothetical protein